MPPWRQPATTSAEPRWLDAGAGTGAYLHICSVGGETDFLWYVWSVLMLVLLLCLVVIFLPFACLLWPSGM